MSDSARHQQLRNHFRIARYARVVILDLLFRLTMEGFHGARLGFGSVQKPSCARHADPRTTAGADGPSSDNSGLA